MKDIEPDIARQSFIQVRPKYESFNGLVRGILESLLENVGITPLSVSGRTKSVESFAEKIGRKNYSDPLSEMTDLCGVRIITFIEADVDRACEVIHSTFNVHRDKSPDKSSQLGLDQFGYRSKHFVCDLGRDRVRIPEYSLFKGMLFEVQVRTVLQHAWAEIEHDRGYKFAGDLPPDIKRRLYLAAAALEGVDRQFSDIARDLDTYSTEVSEKTKKGELDIALNSTSLLEYLFNRFPFEGGRDRAPSANQISKIISELERFGVSNIADLEKLFSEDVGDKNVGDKAFSVYPRSDLITGTLRMAMMLSDAKRFLGEVNQMPIAHLSRRVYDTLVSKYGEEEVEALMKSYKLQI